MTFPLIELTDTQEQQMHAAWANYHLHQDVEEEEQPPISDDFVAAWKMQQQSINIRDEQCEKFAEQVRSQNAIIEQLPTTHDGAYVLPGSVTWCAHTIPFAHKWELRDKAGETYADHCRREREVHFSTRELAAEHLTERDHLIYKEGRGWYRDGRHGYAYISEAGRFTAQEAHKLYCRNEGMHVVQWMSQQMKSLCARCTTDNQLLPLLEKLEASNVG